MQYVAPGSRPDYPNGYRYTMASDTTYGMLSFGYASHGEYDKSVNLQYSESVCYIKYCVNEIKTTFLIIKEQGSHYDELVKLEVNGKVEYDITDRTNPLVNEHLAKLVPGQNRGYIKVLK